MTAVDYSALDNPQASGGSFYPRQHWTDTPEGAVDLAIPVDDGVRLSSRFFPVGRANPTVLFFYGNGETAAGYDSIAPFYNRIGANFCVVDYRGYGASGGSPAFNPMLSDARKALAWLRDAVSSLDFTGPLYVMGRSMGRHAAFELAAAASNQMEAPGQMGTPGPAAVSSQINGVIIESGRPNLGRFTAGLDAATAQALEDAYHAKVYAISIPTLVIHGQLDELAPLPDAVSMHDNIQSENKHLVIIPAAGHNDLMYVGFRQYFEAIRRFIFRYAGGDAGAAESDG